MRIALAFALAFLIVVTALLASPLLAQGNLSTQGFGYPPGQLSTRDVGSAGAFGEFDAQSPINPAALASWGPTALHFQYDPEFRTVQSGGTTEKSTTSRFPLVIVGGPVAGHGAISASWSTLLDRTFSVSANTPINNFTDTVTTLATQTVQSSGGINDLRFAGAWAFGSWLAVGGGFHLFTGENRLIQRITVTDSIPNQYSQSTFKNTLSYSGIGFSAGFTLRPAKWIGLAGSYRDGGTIRIREGDSATIAQGRIPDRAGAALLLNPLTGLLLSGRVDWEGWSRLTSLGQGDLVAKSAVGWSVGADVEGPKIGTARFVTLRFGAGNRPLPYVIGGAQIRETDIGGGLGIPFIAQRATFDISVMHGSRTEALGVAEHSWFLSSGLTIRP